MVFPAVEEIVWFNVSVNDAKLVDVFQRFQQMIDVQTHLFKGQRADDVLTEVKQKHFQTIHTCMETTLMKD